MSVRDENRAALLAAAEGRWSPPQALGNFSGLCEELSGHCRGAYSSIPQGLAITYTRARQFT